MAIEKIKVSNFKSFNELEVELGNFNVLIGANASGKSNFLQIFNFLRDIEQHGLKNAVSLQGGVEYFRNSSIGTSKNFSLEMDYIPPPRVMEWQISVTTNNNQLQKEPLARCFQKTNYRFSVQFAEKGPGFTVAEDELQRILKFCDPKELDSQLDQKKISEMSSGVMTFSNMEGEIKYKFTPEKVSSQLKDILSKYTNVSALFDTMPRLSPQMLFMETSHFDIMKPFDQLLNQLSIYDFDPKIPKKAVPLTGKAELEEDGSNLAIVLKEIIDSEEKRRKFANLINYLLPFVENVQVENLSDKSVLLNLQESYNNNFHLPASFISDGTIQLIALIIALYFEEKPLIIIEEPERNIHPHLISKVVKMLEEASQNKQIIVTTHNPEVIKHTKLENILLVSRDNDGFSIISRPSQREEVKIFLENEIGVEELYVQNLLGA